MEAIAAVFGTARGQIADGASHINYPSTLQAPADGLWIAWPKKSAAIETDLDFDAVQQIGLANGLVDNKSCSVDEDWQALRFVYRLADRTG